MADDHSLADYWSLAIECLCFIGFGVIKQSLGFQSDILSPS